MGNFPGLDSEARPEPALVETDDGWAFALIVEHLPRGFCTVFLPDAPTPTCGSVRIVEASRVRPLEASMINLLGCLTRSGAGAGAIAGIDPRCPEGGGGPLGHGRPYRAERMRSNRVMPRADSDRRFSNARSAESRIRKAVAERSLDLTPHRPYGCKGGSRIRIPRRGGRRVRDSRLPEASNHVLGVSQECGGVVLFILA